jgi:heptosyltransferase-1
MVFDIQGNLKSGLACWLSGADNVIGFAREDLQESVNSIFTTRKVHLRGLDRHVTEKYLRVVSASFGRDFREMSLSSDIYTGADEDAVADALMSTLSDGFVFLFHYGTTWQTKFWSPEGWIELARMLLERFPDSTVLLSWGNEKERKAVTSIASGIGRGARVMDRYGLKGFAAILKRVDVVVGGDTGPVHIAAAVGTPTVSLYRSSDGRSSGPRGERHHVLQSPLSCTRCFKTRCSRDEECRASITAKPLADAVEKLLLQ